MRSKVRADAAPLPGPPGARRQQWLASGAVSPPISDAVAVDVLRRVDRLTAPLVRRLGRPPALPAAERERWWADRVSRVAAGVSAAPRFAGKLADLLPLQNTVGTAMQALVVLGVASEHGVQAPAERISLLARVLLDRPLPSERVSALLRREQDTDEATGAREPHRGIADAGRTLWRAARLLDRIDDALDARPKGRLLHRTMANLPVVGVAGGYLAEREGLRKAAAEAAAVLEGRPVTP